MVVRETALRRILHETDVCFDEALQILSCDLSLDQIHFAQDVYMREFEHEHGTHGAQCAGEELGAVDDEGGFEEVGCAHADVETAARERFEEIGHDGHVAVELDLSGHVDDDEVLVGDLFQRVGEEVDVLKQELEAVDQATVRAQV